MTTMDPTFDAFERRLAATLAAEAATTDVPPDGRARIDRRLAQRRRTRRTTWLAAAAALILVAATVGLLLRDATDESTPYVDTDTVPVDGPPLLLPSDQEARPVLGEWEAGVAYTLRLLDSPLTLGPDGAVRPLLLTVRPAYTDDTRAWRPAVIASRSVDILEEDGAGRVRWRIGPGHQAELSGDLGDLDRPSAALERLVASIRSVTPTEMGDLIDTAARNGHPDSAPGHRLGLLGESATYVRGGLGPEVVTSLVVPGLPPDTYALRSTNLSSLLLPPRPFPGEPTPVRGTTGFVDVREDPRGAEDWVVGWEEDGWRHELFATTAVGLEEVLHTANTLVVLGDDAWAGALFPSDVPAELPTLSQVNAMALSDGPTGSSDRQSDP